MEEQFETFDTEGRPLGLVPRSEVHKRGLWHRSVQVIVVNDQDQLLLQRRAGSKDVAPGCWDYSVGEHLQPGETFEQGAWRGLSEELGITERLTVHPIGGEHWFELSDPIPGVIDREIQRCFAVIYNGAITPATDEVADVKWLSLSAIDRLFQQDANQFTPWFAPHHQLLMSSDWLQSRQ